MKKTIIGFLTLLLISWLVQASVRDEIKALYHSKNLRHIHPVNIFQLKNGHEVNTTDWKIVLFMQGNCHYCQQFDPVLETLSQKTGIKVFAYTLDGKGDTSFPAATPAPAEVVKTFFGQLPIVTPTTFLINVNSLKTVPILQGVTSEQRFMTQLETAFQHIGNNRYAD